MPSEQRNSRAGWICYSLLFVLLCGFFLILPAYAEAKYDGYCPDTCSKDVESVEGIWNPSTEQCEYERHSCKYGCADNGQCAQLKNYEVYSWDIKPIESAECPNYCQDGYAYRDGYYDDYMEECVYVLDECHFGCGDVTCTPTPDDVCPAYCQDGFAYREGYYNEYTYECVYVEDECLFGCGDVTCTPEPEGICSDYCADGKAYREGYFDEVTRDCVYVEDICPSGCDDNYCAVLECASYCEDGTRYYDGWDGDGTCYYSEQECLFGCDGAACARSQRLPSDAAPQFGNDGAWSPPSPEIDTGAVPEALSEPSESFSLQTIFRFLAGLFSSRPEPARLTLDRCEAGSPRVLYGDRVSFGAVVRNDGNTNARADLVTMSIAGMQANFTTQSGDIAPGAERTFWFETRASDHQYRPVIRFGSTTVSCPVVNVVPPSEGIDLVMEDLPQNQTISKYDENAVQIRVRNNGPGLWKYTNKDTIVDVYSVKENSTTQADRKTMWHNIRRGFSDNLDLAAGHAIDLETRLTLQPGVYNINITLDPDSKWAEYFESNNQHTYTLTVTDQAPTNVGDLVPIACDETPREEQKNMMVKVTIQNQGLYPVTIPADVPLARKTQGAVGLAPQYPPQTLVVGPQETFNVTLLGGNYGIPVGEHTYTINVNADDFIAERDRSNNAITCELRVVAQQHFPDLTITEVSGREHGPTADDTHIRAKIANEGDEYVQFGLYAYVVEARPETGTTALGSIHSTPVVLAPGEEFNQEIYPHRPLQGRWVIKVDPYNTIRESDESNNEYVYNG